MEGLQNPLWCLWSLNEVKLKVRAECLVQNWHVINVLSFFFHPLTFWTCIKKKEGFSVPTNHLWISPQYSFNPPTTWFSPFTSLFLFFCSVFPKWKKPVSPMRSPGWWGPSDGCSQCLVDPTLFSFHLYLFILTLVGLCTIHPQVQSPSFCVPWRQGGTQEQKLVGRGCASI